MSRKQLNVLALVAAILITAVLPAGAYELWTNPLTFRNAGSGFSSDDVALTVWNGTVYFADPGTHVIGRLGANGQPIVIAGQYGTAGIADGVGTAAQFSQPSGIAVDAAGNMYVTERGSSRIRKVAPDGTVSAFSGRLYGFGFADGAPNVAIFSTPSAITIDPAGMLYVADRGNNRIRKVTPAGDVTTLAGNNIAGRVDGSATAARFDGPIDVAYGGGYVYVADQNNHAVRKVSTSTGAVTTVAGGITASPADGSGATFGHVLGVTVTPDGTLFVAEDLNTVRRIDPDGWVTTAAGSFFFMSDREGTGYHAHLLSPRRLCALGNNDVLLTD
ncbi:MAG TPA: hypothetical protein VJ032_09940, partial [Thermoanaerobaculia bacterium]|nr:hypothetical protein [Thermoanaerobaculia bacterium]